MIAFVVAAMREHERRRNTAESKRQTKLKCLLPAGAATTEETIPEAMFAGGLTDAVAVPTCSVIQSSH